MDHNPKTGGGFFFPEDLEFAKQLGFNPYKFKTTEMELYRVILSSVAIQNAYLCIRNYILRYWHIQFPNKIMTLEAFLSLGHGCVFIFPECRNLTDIWLNMHTNF
jgi:hypothetical protein